MDTVTALQAGSRLGHSMMLAMANFMREVAEGCAAIADCCRTQGSIAHLLSGFVL